MADDPKPTSKQRVAHPARDKRERAAEPAKAGPSLPAVAEAGNRATLSQIRKGTPLEPKLRAQMERKLGADLSDVKIQTGAEAAALAKGQNARAYTLGSDIVFGTGEYSPHTAQGRRLLTHELAHVVQQQLGGGKTGKADHQASEGEADRVADHKGPAEIAVAAPAVIQRESLNYTPSTPQVRDRYSSPQGYVSVNGNDIAAGTVGDRDKFHVDPYSDPTTKHLSISIKVWPGSDMTFLPGASDTLDAAAPSYTVAIQEHAIRHKNFDDTTGTEYWETKSVLSKAPQPVPPPPKATPKKQPAPKPKAQPKDTPKDPEPEDKPAVYDPLHDDPSPYKRVDFSPAQQMHWALQDHDLAQAAQLASQLGNEDLAALTPVERSMLLWGLALHPTGEDLDLDQVERIFNTAPEGAVMELQHALRAGNGQLLQELRSHAKGDGAARLENAVGGLVMRGIASGAADFDISLSDALKGPPIVVPEDAKSPIMLDGNTPEWMKGMKVWTDDRGGWNFYTQKFGLTTIDDRGKAWNRNWTPGMELLPKIEKFEKNEEELHFTDGMHYVKGRGLLSEEQWQNYLLQNFLQRSKVTSSKVDDIERDVQTWNATQHGFGSWLAHGFAGESEDEPQRILDSTKWGVKHYLTEIGSARTSTDLNETLGHLDFQADSGHALLGGHKDRVMGGGETAIVVIKVTAAGAVVVATGGYALTAAPTVLSLEGAGLAFGGGAAFSAGRQGVQIAEGSLKPGDFSGWQVLGGGVTGVTFYVAPVLMVPASGYGMTKSLDAAEKGHYGTFAFDMAAPIVGAGLTSPRFQKFILPYALGTSMRAASEIPGLSGKSYTGSLPNGPEIVMVMPQGGARAPAPYEITLPGVMPAPNPSAFVGPSTATPGAWSPYNFPIIVNFAPPAAKATPSPAEAGPQGVANAYNTDAPVIDAQPLDLMRMQLPPGVAESGTVGRYSSFGKRNGVGGSIRLDQSQFPFVTLRDTHVTIDEHIHATQGIKQFLPNWSKGGAPVIRWPRSVAAVKDTFDKNQIIALKKGTITPSQFIKQSRAFIWRLWAEARSQGEDVPTEQELSDAIGQFEAKLRTEMNAAGLPTNDW